MRPVSRLLGVVPMCGVADVLSQCQCRHGQPPIHIAYDGPALQAWLLTLHPSSSEKLQSSLHNLQRPPFFKTPASLPGPIDSPTDSHRPL